MPTLPPVTSIVRRDVTMPPPRSLSELRMEDLIAFRIPPYVVPCPCSIAWMKEKVIAPVEVTLDKLCHQLEHSFNWLS